MADKKTSNKSVVADSLLRDLVMSCLASVASILLVRWVSEPTYGFTRHVLIFVGAAALFTLLALLFTGSSLFAKRDPSFWKGRYIVLTVIIKEIGMLALMLSGVAGPKETVHIVIALFSDALFSIGLMVYPRILISRLREEDKAMHSLNERLNALVMGDDEKALELAESAAVSGRYEVLGLITRNPELSGKVKRSFVMYYVSEEQDIYSLEWRLGGIDCILFPKDSGMDKGDGQEHMPQGTKKKSGSQPKIKDNMSRFGKFIKRTFDVSLSGVLLIIFSPLFLICTLAVLIDDGKPVIYAQERIGRGGKPFNIYKFRSMRNDEEAAGPELYAGDNDSRLTRSGRFMRQHHLDELPQLWNVFRGDMSFIGYRPERKFFIDKIMEDNPRYRFLYQIRPGVTSYATLYDGYTDTKEKMLTRLDMDLYYLRNHSVMFDLRILGLTFLNIVGGKKF